MPIGPTGAGSGIQGPIGPAGPAGRNDQGIPGDSGADGLDGIPIPGAQGPIGATGATGTSGIGIPGNDGQDGLDGIPSSPSVSLPAGLILAFGGAVAPGGWLLCDGTAISRAIYGALFATIGTTYGVGDGSTTFNVPDARNRMLIGAGAFAALGASGGSTDHTHTGPSHTHAVTGTHTHTSATHLHAHSATHTHTITDHVHNQSASSHQHILPLDISGGASSVGLHPQTQFGSGPASIRTSALTPAANAASVAQALSSAVAIPAVDAATISANAATPFATDNTTPGATGATSPGPTDASGTAATGTNNPPYLAANYIIKF